MAKNKKAFPQSKENKCYDDGMDLRDYFAAKAMQSMIANPRINEYKNVISKNAYEMADLMLKQREE